VLLSFRVAAFSGEGIAEDVVSAAHFLSVRGVLVNDALKQLASGLDSVSVISVDEHEPLDPQILDAARARQRQLRLEQLPGLRVPGSQINTNRRESVLSVEAWLVMVRIAAAGQSAWCASFCGPRPGLGGRSVGLFAPFSALSGGVTVTLCDREQCRRAAPVRPRMRWGSRLATGR
jgi:hypothetical protein